MDEKNFDLLMKKMYLFMTHTPAGWQTHIINYKLLRVHINYYKNINKYITGPQFT